MTKDLESAWLGLLLLVFNTRGPRLLMDDATLRTVRAAVPPGATCGRCDACVAINQFVESKAGQPVEGEYMPIELAAQADMTTLCEPARIAYDIVIRVGEPSAPN